MRLRVLAAICCGWWLLSGLAAEPYVDKSGSFRVQEQRLEWRDTSRQRAIPVKIYYPERNQPSPVIIFSHGLGGSREGYEYLGNFWASHGYMSVHVQHLGSDDAVWKGNAHPMAAMRQAAASLKNATDRPKDISFVIDRLTALNADGALQGRLDLEKIGVAGHSFGSYTTLAVAGERFTVLGKELTFEDKRVKAAIAMSSPVPGSSRRDLDSAFGKIAIPVFHMTGTDDYSPIGDTSVADRRLPFDHSGKNADALLLTLAGGDHMVFSGRDPKDRKKNAAYEPMHELIRIGSLAFWDAYLLGDSQAKAWLDQGGFAKTVGTAGKLEVKLTQP